MVVGGENWRSTFKLGNYWGILNYNGYWKPLGLQKNKLQEKLKI
jgi:hypothetical protein